MLSAIESAERNRRRRKFKYGRNEWDTIDEKARREGEASQRMHRYANPVPSRLTAMEDKFWEFEIRRLEAV